MTNQGDGQEGSTGVCTLDMISDVDLTAGLEHAIQDSPFPALERAVYDVMCRTKESLYEKMMLEAEKIADLGYELTTKQVVDQMLSWRKKYKHDPAFIIGLGIDLQRPEHTLYLSNGVYEGSIVGKKIDEGGIETLASEDGAIIAGSDGIIKATRILIVADPSKIIADYYGDQVPEGISQAELLGFKEDVNARQKFTIAGSYSIPGAVFYTLGEENGTMRRFQNGRITFSTHPEEFQRCQ